MFTQEDIRKGKSISKGMGRRFWGIISQPDRSIGEKRRYEVV